MPASGRLVHLRNQVFRQLKALRTRGPDDQRIGAWLGQHGDALTRVSGLSGSARAFVEHAVDYRCDLHRQPVFYGDDLDIAGRRRVDRFDDALNAAQVIRVVGDYERVVLRIGRYRVVRRDQGRRIGTIAVADSYCSLNTCSPLVAARGGTLRMITAPPCAWRRPRAPRGRHSGLHDREALQAQRGQQLVIGLLTGHRALGR